jgi:hypothetical protein
LARFTGQWTEHCAGEEELVFVLTEHAAILVGMGQDRNRQLLRNLLLRTSSTLRG